MSKNKGAANAIINAVKKHLGLEKTNLILYTANSAELDFYELEDGAVPEVGDKATFDGKPAGESNDGVYVMQSGETYTFTGEELTAITPAATADEGDDEGAQNALAVENEALKAEIVNLKAALKTEKTNLKVANASLKSANALLNKVAKMNFVDDEDDDDDEEEEEEAPRVRPGKTNKKQASNAAETIDILQSL